MIDLVYEKKKYYLQPILISMYVRFLIVGVSVYAPLSSLITWENIDSIV